MKRALLRSLEDEEVTREMSVTKFGRQGKATRQCKHERCEVRSEVGVCSLQGRRTPHCTKMV